MVSATEGSKGHNSHLGRTVLKIQDFSIIICPSNLVWPKRQNEIKSHFVCGFLSVTVNGSHFKTHSPLTEETNDTVVTQYRTALNKKQKAF